MREAARHLAEALDLLGMLDHGLEFFLFRSGSISFSDRVGQSTADLLLLKSSGFSRFSFLSLRHYTHGRNPKPQKAQDSEKREALRNIGGGVDHEIGAEWDHYVDYTLEFARPDLDPARPAVRCMTADTLIGNAIGSRVAQEIPFFCRQVFEEGFVWVSGQAGPRSMSELIGQVSARSPPDSGVRSVDLDMGGELCLLDGVGEFFNQIAGLAMRVGFTVRVFEFLGRHSLCGEGNLLGVDVL